MSARKKREPDPPNVNEAPAYMGQFASLMTILLAFFIIMLTLGQNRTSQYKEGYGSIRNLAGLKGGTGVLDFWREIRKSPASVVSDDAEDEAEEATPAGLEHGARDSYSLTIDDLKNIDFEDPRRTLRIRSGIRFAPGRTKISRQSQFELDHVTSLLYSLDQHRFVVEVRHEGEHPQADRRLAARRATWLMRHLTEQGRIPQDRIRSAGLSQRLEGEDKGDYTEVVFLIRRITT